MADELVYISEQDREILRKMRALLQNLRIDGPGVTMKRTDDTFQAYVSQPRRESPHPQASAAWVKVTGLIPGPSEGDPTTGGGALYSGRSTTGMPVVTDMTTNLVIPQAPGTVADHDDLVLENAAEANRGNPASHWVQCPDFVVAWPTGKMSENDPTGKARPIWAFYVPRPGPQVIVLWSNRPAIDSVPGGAERYFGNLMVGTGYGIDASSDFKAATTPDPGTAFPFGTPIVFCNVNYAGSNVSPGMCLVKSNTGASQQVAIGTFAGLGSLSNDGTSLIPFYYGQALATMSLFPVTLVRASGDDAGVDGTATTDPTYKYVCYPFVVNGPAFNGGAAMSPVFGGPPGSFHGSFYPATCGIGGYVTGGAFVLLWAFLLPNGFTGTQDFLDASATPHTMTFVNGRLLTIV